jgi:ribose transport system substrate-binding protein
VQAIVNGEQAAERLAGVKATIYPNTGQPPEWVAGVNAGIAQHANLISLVSANPAVLQPQLAQAKAAHIPVVESTLYDVGVPPTRGVTAVSPLPFSAGGRLMADYAILHSRGHVNAIVFVSREVVNAKYLERALRSEFAKHCGASCKMTVVNVPVTAWASRLQSEVQSALLKNPGANYVIPIYDGMVQFAVAGIRAAGATSRVQVISFNGTPAVLKMIQQGGPVVMDVGQPATWFGWIEADQNLRVLTGQKPVMAKEVPLRVFDKTNVASAGNPPTLDGGYGTKYVARFKKLWGLTK